MIECESVATRAHSTRTIPHGRSWPLPILRGTLAIAFGAVSMALADSPLAWLARLFAVYAAADGAVAAAGALRDPASRIPWGSLTRGLFGITAGYMVMQVPTSHPIGFYALLTAWALLTGVFEIVAGLHGYQRHDGAIYQVLHGLVTVFLGMVLLLIPPTGLHAFFPLISLNIAMAGALLLPIGLRVGTVRSDS